MGGFNPFKPIKKAAKKVTKTVGKVAKPTFRTVGRLVEDVVVEPVEKIGKKVATEAFDVAMGTNKEERRYLLYGETPVQTPEVTPEVTPEIVPDDATLMGRGTRRTRGKRAGQAGTIIEGYGSLYRGGSEKAIGG
jgi:NifB/MoaA-like Fe-S oxidoreductase